MIGRRKRDATASLAGWLATSLIDEALRVFGLLTISAFQDDSDLDDDVLGILRTTALDLLDDVSCLASLAATVHSCPLADAAFANETGDDSPLPCQALDALLAYTRRLGAVAVVLADRGHEAAALFAGRAAVANARIATLDS